MKLTLFPSSSSPALPLQCRNLGQSSIHPAKYKQTPTERIITRIKAPTIRLELITKDELQLAIAVWMIDRHCVRWRVGVDERRADARHAWNLPCRIERVAWGARQG